MAQRKTLIEHSRRKFMITVPQEELVNAIKELTPKAYQLLMYYYSKKSGWKFVEDEMVITIDLPNVRALRKYKNELINKGYLFITGSNPEVYFVGKQSVTEFMHDDEDDTARPSVIAEREILSEIKDDVDAIIAEPDGPYEGDPFGDNTKDVDLNLY